ncbi:hypothetical protein BDW66DRAFT_155767 [Aspergillus desertorum]
MAPLELLIVGTAFSTDDDSSHRCWTVQISRQSRKEAGDDAAVLKIQDPWQSEQEENLKWYLEEYPRNPLLQQRRAAFTAAELKAYGRSLADQLVKCPILQSSTTSELVLRISSFQNARSLQQLHWELLEDLEAWGPANRFRTVHIDRWVLCDNPEAPFLGFNGKRVGQKHRILFVVARRTEDGKAVDNIDPQLVTKPALREIRKRSKYIIEAEILRPPTWDSLVRTMNSRPVGYYDMVHFDMHGYVHEETQRALLQFQSETSSATESIPAIQIARMMVVRGVDIVNLNACSSARPSPGNEGNLAFLFARCGVPITIGMAFDILDSAAEMFERVLFEEYLRHWNMYEAVRRGRQALALHRQREGAFKSDLNLVDFFLPCSYTSLQDSAPGKTSENQGTAASPPSHSWVARLSRGMARAISSAFGAYYRTKIARNKRTQPKISSLAPARPKNTLTGRGIIVAEIEQKISKANSNVLFIVGPGGCGKTALLDHLRSWWKETGFVEEVHHFQLQKGGKPYSMWELMNLLHTEAQLHAFGLRKGVRRLGPKSYDEALNVVIQYLQSRKVLLVLDDADFPVILSDECDNVMVMDQTVIPTNLVPDYGYGCQVLANFLERLIGSRSLVLVAARAEPLWISKSLRNNNCYLLPPFRSEDVLSIAGAAIEEKKNSGVISSDTKDWEHLVFFLRHLHFNPLAIKTILPLAMASGAQWSTMPIRLWTGALKPRRPSRGKQPRFLEFVREYLDRSPGPDNLFSLFWMADFVVNLPQDDGVFWFWISTLQNSDVDKLSETSHVLPPSLLEDPNALEAFRQKVRIEEQMHLKRVQLYHSGILIPQLANEDKTTIHPLFSFVARNARFGIQNDKTRARLVYARQQAYWRYILWRQVNMVKHFSSDEGDIPWAQVIPGILEEFPDIISALKLICKPEIVAEAAFVSAATSISPLPFIFVLLSRACAVNRSLQTTYAEIRREYLEKCLKMEEVWLSDLWFLHFTCEHAQSLAMLAMPSQNCAVAGDVPSYVSLIRKLCAQFELKNGKHQSEVIYLHTRKADTAEAMYKAELGQFVTGNRALERLLKEEPEFENATVRHTVTLPILAGWVNSLHGLKPQFPHQHELLKKGEPLRTIIITSGVRTEEQLNRFCPTVQKMLESTYYSLQEPVHLFSLPPRGKRFDTQFQQVYAMAGAASQVAAGISVDHETNDVEQDEKAVRRVVRGMRQQILFSGNATAADISHAKLCEIALVREEWAEAIRHLARYTGRQPSHLPRVHLTCAFCFAKLKLWQAARNHLIYALEVTEQVEDMDLLPVVYGAMAGLECGRRGHYSVLPKLLLVKGLSIVYNSENPTENHLQNRKGLFLGSLLRIIGLENIHVELGIDPRSIPEFSNFANKYAPLQDWESRLCALLTLVDQSVEFKLSNREDGITYDGGKLRRQLHKEAEHIIFLKGQPEVQHFARDLWPQQFIKRPDRATFWDFFEPEPLPSHSLNALLGLGKGKKQLDLDWDIPSDVDAFGFSSMDSSDDDDAADWVKSRCFHEQYLDEGLVPRLARQDDIARDETTRIMSLIQEWVKQGAPEGTEERSQWISNLAEQAVNELLNQST